MLRLEDTLLESEEFLTEYTQRFPKAASSYEQISYIVDSALESCNYESILPLIPYLESEEGYPIFQYISEARYLFRILNILALELKYHLNTFTNNTNSKQTLIQKYKLSLFSLRRILFSLSAESVTEAEDFLLENNLSPFAIYIMSKEELLLPDSSFFQRIEALYQTLWSDTEIQLFRQLAATFMETS